MLAVQTVWALAAYRERWRALCLATVGIVLLYAPWIPSFLVQRRDNAEQRYTDPDSIADGIARLLRAFPGYPFALLREVPGQPWFIALLVLLALAAAAAVWEAVRRQGTPGLPQGAPAKLPLIAALAVAAPLGTVLYSLGPTSIFSPRTLMSSLPAVCVGIGALVTRLRPPWREGAVACLLVLVGIGTVKSLGDEHRRPALRQIADQLHREVRSGDALLSAAGYLTTPALRTHLRGHPRVFTTPATEAEAWKHASDGGVRVPDRRPGRPFDRHAGRGRNPGESASCSET